MAASMLPRSISASPVADGAPSKGEDSNFVALFYVAATANVVRKVICERGATFG
jgi:hypothetical protein